MVIGPEVGRSSPPLAAAVRHVQDGEDPCDICHAQKIATVGRGNFQTGVAGWEQGDVAPQDKPAISQNGRVSIRVLLTGVLDGCALPGGDFQDWGKENSNLVCGSGQAATGDLNGISCLKGNRGIGGIIEKVESGVGG